MKICLLSAQLTRSGTVERSPGSGSSFETGALQWMSTCEQSPSLYAVVTVVSEPTIGEGQKSSSHHLANADLASLQTPARFDPLCLDDYNFTLSPSRFWLGKVRGRAVFCLNLLSLTPPPSLPISLPPPTLNEIDIYIYTYTHLCTLVS